MTKLAVALSVLALALSASAAPAQAKRPCGSVGAEGNRVDITAKRVSCNDAKAIVKALLAGHGVVRVGGHYTLATWPGWNCYRHTHSGECRSRKRRASYVNRVS